MYNSRLPFQALLFRTQLFRLVAFWQQSVRNNGVQYVCNHKNRREAVPR